MHMSPLGAWRGEASRPAPDVPAVKPVGQLGFELAGAGFGVLAQRLLSSVLSSEAFLQRVEGP